MLLNQVLIRNGLTHKAKWCQGHGAVPESIYLGGGLLYYTLVYIFKPELAVVLGSGGGFVPRVIKQAQRDIDVGHTILVDADKPGWGRPDWTDKDSFFRQNYPDIEWWGLDTSDAASRLEQIDYLHIDADHSKAWLDFNNYKGLMSENGIITLHDTIDIQGPRDAVGRIKKLSDWESITLPIGTGITIARKVKES